MGNSKYIFLVFLFGMIASCTRITQIKPFPEEPVPVPVATWDRWAGQYPVFEPRIVFDNVSLETGCVYEKLSGTTPVLYMIYAGYDGAHWRLGRSISSDQGNNWNRDSIALGTGVAGEFDEDDLRHPCVFYDANLDTYFLWYSGYSAGIPRLGYAVSDDGIQWEKKGIALGTGLSGEFDDTYVYGASVSKVGGLYVMYYTANDGSYDSIGRATSMDGKVWNKEGQVLTRDPTDGYGFDDYGVLYPYVVYATDKYVMWYTGKDISGNLQLGYAYSADGINWVKQGPFSPGNGAASPTETSGASNGKYIFLSPNHYRVFYTGYDSGGVGRIHLAKCDDSGTNDCLAPADHFYGGMVMNVQTASYFDSLSVSHVSLARGPSSLWMFYDGYNGVASSIGRASSNGGKSFTRTGVVLSTGGVGSFDESAVAHPDILAIGNSFRMYYRAVSSGGAIAVGTSLSTDEGATWSGRQSVFGTGAAGEFDNANIRSPSVVVFNGIYRVYYIGTNSGQDRVGYRDSNDGISFGSSTPLSLSYPEVPQSISGVDANVVNDTVYLAVCVQTASGGKIVMFTSNDGINFSEGTVILLPKYDFERNGFLSVDLFPAVEGAVNNLYYSSSDGFFERIGLLDLLYR